MGTQEYDYSDEEINTAFHEAGHAIITLRLGHQVDHATIVRDGNVAGSVSHDCDAEPREDYILLLYAGREAERLISYPCPVLPSKRDDHEANNILEKLLPKEEKKSLKLRMRAKARKLVMNNMMTIKGFAVALLENKTLRFEEILVIVESLDEKRDWRTDLKEYREARQAFRTKGENLLNIG